MKKTLVSALTAALVVGAASTTFAAANPFSDVPSDHWAYDAVAQLAKDGVIDGYGDSTYRGDQNITRYEMAQMVARAMAKNDVSAADKAMIDKLAAEFSDELNNLGVRVANLEKKTDNVKWTGEARWRFASNHLENDGSIDQSKGRGSRANTNQFLFRLEPSAQINEHWAAKARIDYFTDTNDAKNVNTSANNNSNSIQVDRMYAEGQYNTTQIRLGKLPFKTADGGMLMDERLSGASVVFGKDVKVTVLGGRYNFNNEPDFASAGLSYTGVYNTGSIQGLQVSDASKKFSWLAGYYNINGIDKDTQLAADNSLYKDDKAGIWELGMGYKFNPNFSMNAAYAKNSKGQAESKFQHAYNIEANYKGANPAKKGSFGLTVAYRYLGNYAVLHPTYNAMTGGNKGWHFIGQYTFDKNILGTVEYFTGKSLGTKSDGSDQNNSKFFTQLEFLF